MIIVGIAGASGSGKSLLSNTIVEELGSDKVVVVSEDRYYKDLAEMDLKERAIVNFDHPNALDHSLLKDHLSKLAKGISVEVPTYDYTTHSRAQKTMFVDHKNTILVLEGILIFTDEKLVDLMNIRIFMDTPSDICFIRRLQRDVIERGRTMDCVVEQYQTTVRPMFLQFIEPSKRKADIIVPNGGKNKIAIDVIRAKMQELLHLHA